MGAVFTTCIVSMPEICVQHFQEGEVKTLCDKCLVSVVGSDQPYGLSLAYHLLLVTAVYREAGENGPSVGDISPPSACHEQRMAIDFN